MSVIGVRETADGKYCAKGYSLSTDSRLFGVVPSKVKIKSSSFYQSSKELSVSCKSIPSAHGYKIEVWTASKKKDTKIASVEIRRPKYSARVSKAAFGKHHMIKIRVCGYTENYGGKKAYGKWSDWKYICPEPDVTKIKKRGEGLELSWDKISGADRYEVYASTKRSSGYKKVKTTTDTHFTMTKLKGKSLKKGTTYYFYVVAYKKVGGKYYSGKAGNANNGWKYSYKF